MVVLSGTQRRSLLAPLTITTGLLFLAAVSGCGVMEDRSERYVNAKEAPVLVLPEGTDETRFSQAMPIRDISVADASKMYPADIPRPPDMTSEILEENYVIEELDGRTWLLVNDVPGRLWPAVSAYMADRGLGVASDSPQSGLLQSEVLNFSKRARQLIQLSDNPGSQEANSILQVRIAPGVRRKSTEIQVRKLVVDNRPDELIPWSGTAEPTSVALALQKGVLADMGEFLKAREENKSFSRAASGIVSDPLVKLISENDTAVAIRMDLDYGRSWAEVNRALAEAGIGITDLNRSDGWLYVDFRTTDERSSGWFDWFSDNEQPRHTHTVRLKEQGGLVIITAERVDGYEGDNSAADLLKQLFDYLY
jgi:outer membrane protein assembly factor BamC